MERYTGRARAERYRDRFKTGRRRRTHLKEARALDSLLARCGKLGTILDAGSGTGRMLPILAAHAERVIQADYSWEMLKINREDYPPEKGGGLLVQADARHLPLPNGSVDLIFCHRLLNHLDHRDRMQALAEFARVARTWIVVSCLTPLSLLRVVRRAYARLSGRGSVDGMVEPSDLLRDADEIGLRLAARTHIRRFPSGEFFTLTR